jgi:hypothetical protein
MFLLKFITSLFISFIIYSGLFYSVGGYLLRSYFAKDAVYLRAAEEMGRMLPLTTLLNFINALVFVSGFLVFRKAFPNGKGTIKGLIYGILMPFFGASIPMMFYYYALFNVKIEITIIFSACLLVGGIMNGMLSGIIFGEKHEVPETKEDEASW